MGMPKIYSEDFRLQAIRCVERGMSRPQVCEIFEISMATLCRWLAQYRQTGAVTPVTRGSYRTRKVDREALVRLVEKQPDATLHELADAFDTWPSVIDYHLRKLKITRKKNDAVRGAGRRKTATLSGRDRADRSREVGVPG